MNNNNNNNNNNHNHNHNNNKTKTADYELAYKHQRIHLIVVCVLLILSIIIIFCMAIKRNNSAKQHKEINTEITSTNNNISTNNDVDELFSESQSHTDEMSSNEPQIQEIKTTYILSNGTYTVGEDINSGTYNLISQQGYGLITGDLQSGYISTSIGIWDLKPGKETYNNLELSQGDTFTITGGVEIEFVLQ